MKKEAMRDTKVVDGVKIVEVVGVWMIGLKLAIIVGLVIENIQRRPGGRLEPNGKLRVFIGKIRRRGDDGLWGNQYELVLRQETICPRQHFVPIEFLPCFQIPIGLRYLLGGGGN